MTREREQFPGGANYSAPGNGSRSLDVLVVEDNPDEAALLAALLDRWGHAVTIAGDGDEALAHLARLAEEAPDLVLIDIGLPTIDGFEVARRIRGTDSMQRSVLVAVSGYSNAAPFAPIGANEFDDFYVKPLELSALRQLTERLRQDGRSRRRG